MIAVPHAFIVDDEEIVRGSLGRLLRAIGVPNTGFASAEAFLAGYSGAPGCLIVDIRMPGMSGLDLLEELQRRGTMIPAIVITGHTDEGSLGAACRRAAGEAVFDGAVEGDAGADSWRSGHGGAR
jgi:two-component system response regulator FixJ